ncbi:glycosyltransferase family 2 protein [Lachnoclostridium phytofermentans]|uniref:glycosyltransferase family 2 protein n=1 Tax=Lachnoclostridium phytofermentans TaxID=66219 RepID=UPI0004975A1F|nr:glycosyltransferase family 2 protein [Lachnoclostridium phytofermentans]
MTKKVIILLSTYNGEKYLEEQLESILKQDYRVTALFIRDDGSTDGTVDILEKYAKIDPRIAYYVGSNIGASNSFFELIEQCKINADYYAFSDQDDVWLSNKLSKALKILSQNENIPYLYCSEPNIVNEKLESIKPPFQYNNIKLDFRNALVENMCTGCTAVLNKKLFELLQVKRPNFAIMHDFWFYLVASCFGTVYRDNESYVLYRQHQNNVIGVSRGIFFHYLKRIKNFNRNRSLLYLQAKELQNIYSLEDVNKEILKDFLLSKTSFSYRIKILYKKELFRQNKLDNLIMKVLLILGLL